MDTKEPAIEIDQVRKNLKNTGSSVFAVGWLTIILNVGLYLWSIADASFAETGLPTPDLAGTLLVVLASLVFIILGSRIKAGNEKGTKSYLQILLGLSLVLIVFAVATGGRVGLLFFLLLFYLGSSLSKFSRAMRSEEFRSTLVSPVHTISRSGWIIFGIASFIILIVAATLDLSGGVAGVPVNTTQPQQLSELDIARQRARDTKRIADVNQIRTAAEQYFEDHNGSYPTAINATTVGVYLKTIPVDPLTGENYGYIYGPTAAPTQYDVIAELEQYSSALTTDADLKWELAAGGNIDGATEACTPAPADCLYDQGVQ